MRALLVLVPMCVLVASCEGDVYRLDHDERPILPGDPIAPPSTYRDAENPFVDDASAVAAGASIFAMRCSGCHGDEGRGDGPRAARLDPAPADLSELDDESDGYLLWRIEDGADGVPFDSAMPAFSDSLTEDEAWQLVSFVRSLGAPDEVDPPEGDVTPDVDPEAPMTPDAMRAPPSEPPGV